jgi:hypothetical protein
MVVIVAATLTSCGGGSNGASPSPTPTAPQTTFGAGQHRVNVDIAPGRYFSAPRAGCSFERTGAGGARITNDGFTEDYVQFIIDIDASDAMFTTNTQCGTWTKDKPLTGPLSVIPAGGAWLVGRQVSPGRYSPTFPRVGGCFWHRLRNFGDTSDGDIDRGQIGPGGAAGVEILASDVGFRADVFCGEWNRIQ